MVDDKESNDNSAEDNDSIESMVAKVEDLKQVLLKKGLKEGVLDTAFR